jgi:hypothetical protein
LQLLHSVFSNVRANAMIALANTVHFHESNRRRLMYESPGSMELLVQLLDDDNVNVQQHTARCIGAACHNDVVAKMAGEYLGMVSGLVRLLWSSSGQTQRFAAFALKNLALYDPNKKRILVEGGVEGLTHCAASTSHQARDMVRSKIEKNEK